MGSFKDKGGQKGELNNIKEKFNKDYHNSDINIKEYRIYMNKIKSKYINKYHSLKNKAEASIWATVGIILIIIALILAFYYTKK